MRGLDTVVAVLLALCEGKDAKVEQAADLHFGDVFVGTFEKMGCDYDQSPQAPDTRHALIYICAYLVPM